MEQHAREIIARLKQNGHAAYMVGGYVRDKCLGRPVKDIDIATSARPEQVAELFPRTAPTGLKHGTVTVIMEGVPYEVTTFREEAEYEDFRRPREVRFIQDLEGDLRRRDFTMNAMAMDEEGRLIDPFGGLRDLRQGIIRCVGAADERFSEDALRMLRCIRFAAEYGLQIAPDTWEAIHKQGRLLRHVAMERVLAELDRIMAGSDPLRGLRLLVDSRLYMWFKSGMNWPAERWKRSVQYPPLASIGRIERPNLRWCMWLIALQCDREEARQFLRSLKCSNAMIREITALIEWHALAKNMRGEQEWKLASLRFDKQVPLDWLSIVESTSMESAESIAPDLIRCGAAWIGEMPVHHVRDLDVSGLDIQAFPGMKGPRIRRTLERLLKETALGKLPNRKDKLLAQVRKWIEEPDHEQ